MAIVGDDNVYQLVGNRFIAYLRDNDFQVSKLNFGGEASPQAVQKAIDEKAFPIGGLDLERLQGDLTLRVSAGGEKFFPIGEQDAEMTLPQEIIYSDRRAVVTRCLNWRDSARYGVNSSTKKVLFIIENANPEREADYQQAIVLLQKRLQDYLQLSTTVQVLDQEHPQVEL